MTNEHEIHVRDARIRYRDSGTNGPVVLLTHGIGCMLETFEPTYAALSSRYRVISWDQPGFGRSDAGGTSYSVPLFADFAFAFLDALGIEKAHLVGHSMGGGVSLRMARSHPERVQSLTLDAAATLGREAPLIFRLFLLPMLGHLLSAPTRANAKQALKASFKDYARVPSGLEEVWYQCSAQPGGHQFFLSVLKTMTNFRGQRPELIQESLEALPHLSVPVLLIHGRQDALILVSHSIAAAKLIPNARLEIIEDCGHFPQLEKAAEFNSILSSFLAVQAR